MDRYKIEKITASLSVFLLCILALGGILLAGNVFFSWNLFPPEIEKVIYFAGLSIFIVMIASVAVNIMLNISILANNSAILVRSTPKSNAHRT